MRSNDASLRLIRRRVRIVSAGRTRFNTSCPVCEHRFHKKDKKHALWVDLDKNYCVCFRCNTRGQVYPDDKRDWSPQPANEICAATVPFPQHYQPLTSARRNQEAYTLYAETRHIPRELWDELHVGFCDAGPYRGRLILPIVNNNRLEGWVARSVLPRDRAYLYPKGMTRGSTMFNLSRIADPSPHPLLVVEGWLDAIYLWPHAVAVLGTPSKNHMEMLLSAKSDVVFVLDGDAWRQADALAMSLRLQGKRSGFVRLPPTLDPDEIDRDHLLTLADKARKES